MLWKCYRDYESQNYSSIPTKFLEFHLETKIPNLVILISPVISAPPKIAVLVVKYVTYTLRWIRRDRRTFEVSTKSIESKVVVCCGIPRLRGFAKQLAECCANKIIYRVPPDFDSGLSNCFNPEYIKLRRAASSFEVPRSGTKLFGTRIPGFVSPSSRA